MLGEIHIDYGHKNFLAFLIWILLHIRNYVSMMQSLLCQCREQRDENPCSHQEEINIPLIVS